MAKRARRPKAKAAPVGRPPLPTGTKKHRRYPLNLSDEERELVRQAAAKDDDKPATWGRKRLVAAARARLAEAAAPKKTPAK
jgi:hypothetical protein